jgi:hypothetical protein
MDRGAALLLIVTTTTTPLEYVFGFKAQST